MRMTFATLAVGAVCFWSCGEVYAQQCRGGGGGMAAIQGGMRGMGGRGMGMRRMGGRGGGGQGMGGMKMMQMARKTMQFRQRSRNGRQQPMFSYSSILAHHNSNTQASRSSSGKNIRNATNPNTKRAKLNARLKERKEDRRQKRLARQKK